MRKSNTESLGNILKQFVQENRLERKLSEVDIIDSWQEIMGRTVASYTRDLRITNGILFVRTSSPILRNELLMMKSEIIRRMNEHAGSPVIHQIIFS